MDNSRRYLIIFLIFILLVGIFMGCSNESEENTKKTTHLNIALTDENTNEAIEDASLVLHKHKAVVSTTETDENGKATIAVKQDTEYRLNIVKENYYNINGYRLKMTKRIKDLNIDLISYTNQDTSFDIDFAQKQTLKDIGLVGNSITINNDSVIEKLKAVGLNQIKVSEADINDLKSFLETREQILGYCLDFSFIKTNDSLQFKHLEKSSTKEFSGFIEYSFLIEMITSELNNTALEKYNIIVVIKNSKGIETYRQRAVSTDGKYFYALIPTIYKGELANNLTILFTYKADRKESKDDIVLKSIEELNSKKVSYGTELSDISLPAKLLVTRADDTKLIVPVNWDKENVNPSYNPNQPGEYVIAGRLDIKDLDNLYNPDNIIPSIIVKVSKTEPVFEEIEDKRVNENSKLTFVVKASDPNGYPVTLTVENLPKGASFNPESGKFSWTPTYNQAGNYELVFKADNGEFATDKKVKIIVSNSNRAPVLDEIEDKNIKEGEELSFKVEAFDPDGDEIALSSSNLPAESSFNKETGEFYWEPNYSDSGIYELKFTASDGQLTDSKKLTITVNYVIRFDNLIINKLSYKVGDTIIITSETNEPVNLTADFSNIDDQYITGEENITDNGDNTYNISYTIKAGRSKGDGLYKIPITAEDSDGFTKNTEVSAKLENIQEVETAEELKTAVGNKNIHKIMLTTDINQELTGNNKITHPLTFDFKEYKLSGSVEFIHDKTESSILLENGGVSPEITGDLTVNTPNASFENNVNIGGTVNIVNVKADTWTEKIDDNKIIVTDKDGSTLVIEGDSESIIVKEPSESAISIIVENGESVNKITSKLDIPLMITIKENAIVNTLAGDGDVLISGQGSVNNIINSGIVSAEDINTIFPDSKVAVADNQITYAAAPAPEMTVWIAPANTFKADLNVSNNNMTKMTGDGIKNVMNTPIVDGIYKVITIDNEGNKRESSANIKVQNVNTVYQSIQTVTANSTLIFDIAPLENMVAWIAPQDTSIDNLSESNNMTKLECDGLNKKINVPKKSGTYRIMLVDSYNNKVETSKQLNIKPDNAASFTVEDSKSIYQGEELKVSISNLQDQYGNLISGEYDVGIIENIGGLNLTQTNVTFIGGTSTDIQLLSSSDTTNISANSYGGLDVKVGNIIQANSFDLRIYPVLNSFNMEAECINQGEIVDIKIGSFKDLNNDNMYLGSYERVKITVSDPYGEIFYNESLHCDLSDQNNIISLTSFNTEVPSTWYIYKVVISGITRSSTSAQYYIYPVPDPDECSASANRISSYTVEIAARIYDKVGEPITLLNGDDIKLVVENMEDDDGINYLYKDDTLYNWDDYEDFNFIAGYLEGDTYESMNLLNGKYIWTMEWNEENKDSDKRIYQEWRIKAKYPTNDEWVIIYSSGTNLDFSK